MIDAIGRGTADNALSHKTERAMVTSAQRARPAARKSRAARKPAAGHDGASLVTTVARQLQSLATSVLGNVGTATEMAFTLAQSKIQRPGPKAAVEKAAAVLRDLRQAAGLTLEDLGRALEVDDPSFMGLVETGKVGLPFELILRLTAVLGRNDPVGFMLQMTRAYNPRMWKTLELVGVGQLLVQAGREREFANIYRSHDAARALSDADFAAALSFADAAFTSALAFLAKQGSPAPAAAAPRPPRQARRREG